MTRNSKILSILIVALFLSFNTLSAQTTMWAEQIAGEGSERANGIVVDNAGNVYVAGYFDSPTLSFNNGKILTNSGSIDAYIAKYNSRGECQWAEKIAGSAFEVASSIAVDNAGNVYVAGYFSSSPLNFNNGKSLSNQDINDVFIAKYDNNGECQWAEQIEGDDYDYVYSIAVDNAGNVYVAGHFDSSTLTFNNGKSLPSVGSNDAYIAKYDNSGECQWAELIAGTYSDIVYSIAVDSDGNVYVAGVFGSSPLNFNNGKSLSNVNTSSRDVFIAKYDNSGECQWAEQISGSSTETANGIAVDSDGNVYVAGYTFSSITTFNNGKSLTKIGSLDAYIAKYNNSGLCQWAEQITGDGTNDANGIAVDSDGNVYVAGNFSSSILTFNNSKLLSNSSDDDDVYIAKYDNSGECQWAEQIAGDNWEFAKSIAVDNVSNVYVAGYTFSSTLTFNNSKTLTNVGSVDAYIAKYIPISTKDISNITHNSATSGGDISYNSSVSVTARGVCWSTSPNPTIANGTTLNGTGTGTFTSTITGLAKGTTYYVRAYATYSGSTSYGEELSFTTHTIPTLTTTIVSDFDYNSATIEGEIISDGGESVLVRGVCWSTSPNPILENADYIIEGGTGTGTFTSTITGLAKGTTYYVRAYATNSAGTSYSNQVSFTTLIEPTLITTEVTNITHNSATSGGNVSNDGGATVTARGICWSTNSNPTLENADGIIDGGTGTGTFTSTISGLAKGTTYYVRAYAANSVGTSYGTQVPFTTLIEPTLTTTEVTNITHNSATSGGVIINDGGDNITEHGVCWSENQEPTIANAKTTQGILSAGSFTSTITGLAKGTTYYVRAYATNSAGTSYGNQVSFTTLIEPTLTTTEVTDITHNSATSGGNVSNDGGATVTARGICWSTSPNPTLEIADGIIDGGTGTGTFTSTITGLAKGTTYYVRAYATNSAGTSYGNQVSFKTLKEPTVTTTEVTDITHNSAQSGGDISDDGGYAVIARGLCWSENPNPTTSNFTTDEGEGTGTFTSSIGGLYRATTYYVRAYATNLAGTSYGEERIFTTSALLPLVSAPIKTTKVTFWSALSGGSIIDDGGAEISERGVCISKNRYPDIDDIKFKADEAGIGAFTVDIYGLEASTKYYIRVYAINDGGVAYGKERTFTTPPLPPGTY